MEKEDISRRLWRAIEKLVDRDHYLLVRDVNERSITHRLAIYLQEEFPDMDVDCEYNRTGFDTKRLEYFYPPHADTGDTSARTVFPDIIVHKRGGEGPNLLVIEAKKLTNASADDLEKLKAFKSDPLLKYGYAVFLQFPTGEDRRRVQVEFV